MTHAALRLSALTLLAWTACFIVLRHFGTWTPFAVVGLSLAALSVWTQSVPRGLLRPSPRSVMVGVAAGALMVVVTHAAYAWLVALVPGVAHSALELFVLLNVVGFSTPVRAALIVVIASCEEVLFRGLLPRFAARYPSAPHVPGRNETALLLLLSAIYAATTAPLGNPLLVLCALVCGFFWGTLRILTGSVVVPILAHVVWDLGVLWLWPLVPLVA